MSFIEKSDIQRLYKESKTEAHIWREAYPAFERLADNGLMDGLDESLPEVNDGSLAAALFKLPKRIVSSKLRGNVKATNRDEDWLSELANLQWQNEIMPNANSQAPFHRKWKDAVRKAAIYGSVPLITLFLEKDDKNITDFIVSQPQDVTLEPGKVSDYDSDVIFWDVYYSKSQLQGMIEDAKSEDAENKKNKEKDEYNKWDIPALEAILKSKDIEEKSAQDRRNDGKKRPSGFKFCVVVQRGVNAPFYMYHNEQDVAVREWTNPDPTGDVPIHFLYCYQDFINPYGIGIVKLAGGTQNVLDYMRQADVLATQLGLRPPIAIEGREEDVDIDSIVYAQDAIWFTGGAKVVRQELANGVYDRLPERINMYKTSLNQLIPMGDTSISQGAGDPQQSKTPAGVRFQASNLSIDDEDFKDNLYVTYAAVAKSMINTHFANMEGSDLMKLSDEERGILQKAGMNFPQDDNGEMSNQLEVVWDTARAKFDFTVDPSSGVITNDQDQVANIKEALTSISPAVNYYMSQDGFKFNLGEAYHNLFSKMNLENLDKIITKMSDEEKTAAKNAPFPIIDPPTIRLTGQIPNGAMGAALQQGGVIVNPQENNMQEAVDLGDIYKDPRTGPSVLAQIQQMAGIQQPDIVQQPDPNANDGAVQAESEAKAQDMQVKQQELGIKQQGIDQRTAELVMKSHQQHHTQAMDMLNAVQAPQPPEPVATKKKVLTNAAK